MPSPQRETRQPFTVLLPDGPRRPMEIHDHEVGLVMALVDKAGVPALGEDWNAVGAYILLGTVAEDGTYPVYVGKSPMGLRSRLMEHGRSRAWTRGLLIRRAVLHGFTSAHAGWLEGDLYDLFSAATRARVENLVTPRDDTVPPYELRMLRSLRDPIVRVLRMLGYETESAPEVVEPVQEALPEQGTAPATKPAARSRGTRAAYGVSIADLLGAGLLSGGQQLVSTSNAWPARAVLNDDATITLEGRIHPSASAAAAAASGGTPANGWDFWALDDGDTTRLSTLRQRFLERRTIEATHGSWRPPTADELRPRHVSVRKQGARAPRTEFNVTVSDLLAAGLLRGGDRLVSADPSSPAEALVGYDGAITWNEQSYATPSTAAQAVKGDRNTNGWMFWAVQGPDGEVRLDDLRKQHLGLATAGGRKGPAQYGVELVELVDAGLVEPGTVLVSTSRSYPAAAYVDDAGCVVHDGVVYQASSAAADVVRGGRSTNGWDFWAIERDGLPVRLSQVRAEYLSSAEGDEDA